MPPSQTQLVEAKPRAANAGIHRRTAEDGIRPGAVLQRGIATRKPGGTATHIRELLRRCPMARLLPLAAARRGGA